MKNKFFKYSYLIFIIFINQTLKAQDVPVDNELEKKYTPNSNSIFNSLIRKQNESGSVKIKNAIKLTPTALFRQKILLWYEREIFSNFTINLGIGKPFGKDYIQSSYFTLFSDIKNEDDTDFLTPGDMQRNAKYAGRGITFAIAPRIYFDEAFENGYIEIAYMYEQVDLTIKGNEYSYPSQEIRGNPVSTFKMNALSINWGYTWLAGYKENIVNEFFIGVGVKYFSYDAFHKYTSNTSFPAQDYYQKNGTILNTKLFPCIYCGYSIGFGF